MQKTPRIELRGFFGPRRKINATRRHETPRQANYPTLTPRHATGLQ